MIPAPPQFLAASPRRPQNPTSGPVPGAALRMGYPKANDLSPPRLPPRRRPVVTGPDVAGPAWLRLSSGY